jgi:hypothetical protein
MNETRYLLCIANDDAPASLEVRKLYAVISDPKSEALGYVRVIDESGEDYLHPKQWFMPLTLPEAAMAAMAKIR